MITAEIVVVFFWLVMENANGRVIDISVLWRKEQPALALYSGMHFGHGSNFARYNTLAQHLQIIATSIAILIIIIIMLIGMVMVIGVVSLMLQFY